jgi:CheY-like chemotaxis protein
MMPVSNGWDVLAARAKDPALAKIPVVVITGKGDREVAFEPPNVAAFLRKPLDPQVVVRLAGRALLGSARLS